MGVTYFVEKLNHWAIDKDNMRMFPWRETKRTYYEKVICEFLLQRTKAETIAKFYPKFIKKYPDWNAIAADTVGNIINFIEEIGLSKQRGPRIHNVATYYMKNEFKDDREQLQEIVGVGHYIASAILLFYFNRSEPLIDSSIDRFLDRLVKSKTKVDYRYDENLWELARNLIQGFKDPSLGNWILLDFAALVCKKDPLCKLCVLKEKCLYLSES